MSDYILTAIYALLATASMAIVGSVASGGVLGVIVVGWAILANTAGLILLIPAVTAINLIRRNHHNRLIVEA